MHGINKTATHSNCRQVIDRILDTIAAPLIKTPGYLASLIFLDIIVLFWFIIFQDSSITNLNSKIYSVINLSARGFLISWITLSVYLCISGKTHCRRILGRLWLGFIFLMTGISATIDVVILCTQHDCFSAGYCDILLQTNYNESTDFIATYLTYDILFIVAAVIVMCLILAKLPIRLSKSRYIGPFLLITSLILCLVCTDFYGSSDLYGKIRLISIIEPSVRLKMTSEQIYRTDSKPAPQKIVLIIGESYARSHCALYDYRLCTTPNLINLKNDSLLYTFTSVRSPGLTTLHAFKQIIGTWNDEKQSESKWYECPTIPEVAHKAGYCTYWLSNQSPNGLYDNQITYIAELADTTIFTTNTFNKNDVTDFDGTLLPIINRFADDNRNEFFIVHLMGSHFKYDNRYPADFHPFSDSDFKTLPENQRKITREYDTSIAYNDSIVSTIFNRFKNQDAIAIYFPDHGEDIYESSPDRFGHGNPAYPESVEIGKTIPFIVYVTPEFRRRHPDLTGRIAQSVNRKFDTTNTIYTIMDIMGVRFQSNNNVDLYSLFRNHDN